MSHQEKIFELLLNKDDVTWQTIIYELVRSEQMDPWDIDVSLLAKRYIDMLKKLKELNFRVSGRVVLAAAVFLKIKSKKLVGQDIEELDRLFSSNIEDTDELFYEDYEGVSADDVKEKIPSLIPRTPQPRKRKVSIYDLVDALQKALEVKERKVMRSIPKTRVGLPEKSRDVSLVIKEVYLKVKKLFSKGDRRITFTNLVPSDSREEKIHTFIPLLHLSNQRKIDLLQFEHFGEIDILLNPSKVHKKVN